MNEQLSTQVLPMNRDKIVPPAEDPATGPLFKVFPRPLVIVFGVLSGTFLLAVVYFGMFQSFRFQDPMARSWLVVAFSVCFAIFFFLFFPQEIKIEKIAPFDRAIDLGVKIAGPVALFLIIFSVLNKFIPPGTDLSTRYFEARYASGEANVGGYQDNFKIDWHGENKPTFIRVMDDNANLQGVIVEFSGGATKYEGTAKDYRHQKKDIRLCLFEG